MKEIPTPLTDYASFMAQHRGSNFMQCVQSDFARLLERDRRELREALNGILYSTTPRAENKAYDKACALLERMKP